MKTLGSGRTCDTPDMGRSSCQNFVSGHLGSDDRENSHLWASLSATHDRCLWAMTGEISPCSVIFPLRQPKIAQWTHGIGCHMPWWKALPAWPFPRKVDFYNAAFCLTLLRRKLSAASFNCNHSNWALPDPFFFSLFMRLWQEHVFRQKWLNRIHL